MKPPLVLSTLVGGMVLIGAVAVGTTYLAHHRVQPTRQPLAQAAPPPPQVSAPPAADESQLPRPERPRPMRVRSHRRACPVPVVYHTHRSRLRPLRVAAVQRAYGPAPIYAPPPAPVGWYGHPYWRAEWRGPGWRGPGWRGPGWRYPPRWAYGPHPGYGLGWRGW